MPFSRPTLERLISRARADIESAFQNGAAYVRRSVEYVLASVIGGTAHGLYGFLSFISKQIIPTTAESAFLDEWGRFWLTGGRHEATAAVFEITVTGGGGVFMPAGTQWTAPNSTGGTRAYLTNADVNFTVAPQQLQIEVTAVIPGDAGNIVAGTILTLSSPITGIVPAATTVVLGAGPFGDAEDRETDAQLLQRIIERVQSPPSGGGPGDYVVWAKEVNGVTRAWQQPLALGPSTVRVLFVRDEFDDDGNFVQTGFPSGGQITEVQTHIDAVAPVIAIVTVDGPDSLEIDMTIQISPNTSAVQAAVTASLQDLFLREAAPDGTLPLSHIREAISNATGEEDSILITPVADVASAVTELPIVGTLTFQNIP